MAFYVNERQYCYHPDDVLFELERDKDTGDMDLWVLTPNGCGRSRQRLLFITHEGRLVLCGVDNMPDGLCETEGGSIRLTDVSLNHVKEDYKLVDHNRVREEHADLVKQIETLTRDKEKLRADLQDSCTTLADLRVSLQANQQEVLTRGQRINELLKLVDSRDRTIDGLVRHETELRAQCDQQATIIKGLHEVIDTRNKAIDELKRRLAKVHNSYDQVAEIRELQTQREFYKMECSKLRAEMAAQGALIASMSQSEHERQKAVKEIERLQTQLRTVDAAHSNLISQRFKLWDERTALQKQLAEKAILIRSLSEARTATEISVEVRELQDRIRAWENTCENLRRQVDNRQRIIDDHARALQQHTSAARSMLAMQQAAACGMCTSVTPRRF